MKIDNPYVASRALSLLATVAVMLFLVPLTRESWYIATPLVLLAVLELVLWGFAITDDSDLDR